MESGPGSKLRWVADGLKLELMVRGCGLGIEGVSRKVDVRLPAKGDSNSHGARPVY